MKMDLYDYDRFYQPPGQRCYLPVALALHFARFATEKNLKQADDILIEYFQGELREKLAAVDESEVLKRGMFEEDP